MTWHYKYIDKVLHDAQQYQVTIDRVNVGNNPHFVTTCVHHLLPEENKGGHNLYLDALNEKGERLNGITFEVTNFNGFKSYPRIDKPAYEPGTNVPMNFGDTLSVRMPNISSDTVFNIHTRWDDEFGPNGEKWNSRGHHSFYVVFWYRMTGIVVPPVDPELPPLKDLFTPEQLFAIEHYPFVKIRELIK